MSGRLEHETEINLAVMKGLENQPKILKDYFRWSSGKAVTTRRVFINRIKRFFSWLESNGCDIYDIHQICSVSTAEIEDYIATMRDGGIEGQHKKVAEKTLNDVWIAIDNFYSFLVKRKYIKENPATEAKDQIKRYIDDKDVIYLTEDEVKVIKNDILTTSKTPKRDVCLFILGCRTGLRATALSEIDISDIDFDVMAIHVIEKGNYKRSISIDADTKKLILDCIEERGTVNTTDALFVVRRGGEIRRIKQKGIANMIERHTQCVGKHITPHKMRSTCITAVYNHTGDIYKAAYRAGHKSLSNTRKYINNAKLDQEVTDLMGSMF